MRRSRSTDERARQFDPFAFQIKPEEKVSSLVCYIMMMMMMMMMMMIASAS
jgi:hypothetical protein